MAPRFIGKTSLTGLYPVFHAGRPVLDQFTALQQRLRDAAPDVASLFAEPVVTWPAAGPGAEAGLGAGAPGSVSWYSEAAGTAEPLAALSPHHREMVVERLRRAIGQLQPLMAEAGFGPLLHAALSLGAQDAGPEGGVVSVGGAPVLMGWGLSADPAGMAATAWMQQFAPVSPVAVQAAPVRMASAGPGGGPAAAAPGVPGVRSTWNWALVPAATVVAVVFLGLGLWAGIGAVSSRVAQRPSTVGLLDEQATRDATERQRQQNAALEQEIEARKRLLAGNVCSIDPAQMPRLGPDRAAAVPPGAVVPPPGAQAFQGSLADLLTQAVVLIIAPAAGPDGGVSTGTGFFVAPDLIVTNRHVIEGANPAEIVVTSRKLARTTPARIVAQSPNSEIGSLDVALLRVEAAPGIQPLSFSPTVAPLDQVIAAGFPGLLLEADEAFDRLRHGDTAAVPEVILTDGRVNAIQSAASGLKIIPHSAAVSGGNSGGPLTDACGRVVGVNTFITANRQQVVHANYAQKADGVVAFLKENGVAVTELTAPCVPSAPPVVVPPAVVPPGVVPPGGGNPATPPSPAVLPAAPPAAPPAAR